MNQLSRKFFIISEEAAGVVQQLLLLLQPPPPSSLAGGLNSGILSTALPTFVLVVSEWLLRPRTQTFAHTHTQTCTQKTFFIFLHNLFYNKWESERSSGW